MTPVALVTGATGFIGRHLVGQLRQSGCRVRALVRNPGKFKRLYGDQSEIELAVGDFSRPEPLAEAIGGVSWLFHLAGATKALRAAEFYQANQKDSNLLYETVRNTPNTIEKIVHVSSLAAVGPSPPATPPEEIAPPHPLTHYGRSKLLGEATALAIADRFNVTVIRPPAVFGPGDLDVLHFFKAVARGLIPIMGNDDKRISLVYAADLARGLIQAARADIPSGRCYFLAYDEAYRWSEFGRLAARLLHRSSRTVHVPIPMMRLVAGISQGWSQLSRRPTILNLEKIREIKQQYWVCSPAAARRDFGFAPAAGLEADLSETIRWYREHGHLSR